MKFRITFIFSHENYQRYHLNSTPSVFGIIGVYIYILQRANEYTYTRGKSERERGDNIHEQPKLYRWKNFLFEKLYLVGTPS